MKQFIQNGMCVFINELPLMERDDGTLFTKKSSKYFYGKQEIIRNLITEYSFNDGIFKITKRTGEVYPA